MDLKDFFAENRKVALAFSGGVDSAYLLYEACKQNVDITAYYVKSQFQPEFEYKDAIRIANYCKANMKVIEVDVLADDRIASNPENRCYYCKKAIFKAILDMAKEDGYMTIIDGTNASDKVDERPGMKALEEMSVYSPLRICGLTKQDIREKSKEAGLDTWDKAAYACLATRECVGELITKASLERTEWAEEYLAALGFVDFRVRKFHDCGRIQIRSNQLDLFIKNAEKIQKELSQRYKEVFLDLKFR